jgi:hypothetical protein
MAETTPLPDDLQRLYTRQIQFTFHLLQSARRRADLAQVEFRDARQHAQAAEANVEELEEELDTLIDAFRAEFPGAALVLD